MMLQMVRGGFVALSEVVEMHAPTGKERYEIVARLRDGRTVNLIGNVYEMLELINPVIPAFAGFELLQLIRGEAPDRWETLRQPVIGWRTYPDGRVEPVGPEGTGDFVTSSTFKLPDGQVMTSGADQLFDNEAAWFKYAVDRAEAAEAEAAAKRLKQV